MAYKKFTVILIFRIILLAFSMFLFFLLIDLQQYYITAGILALLIILQVYLLIRYVERTNRKLTQFLEGIRHADFSRSFSDHGLGKSFEGLNDEFNKVMDAFRRYRSEKEEHFNYLHTVVEHVSIGIIAYSKEGNVDIFNNAVKRMLKIRNLRHIHDLDKVKSDFSEILLNLKSGNSTLVKLFIEDELLQLSIYATEFRLRNEEFILITLQDITAELDQKEIESWQKLIRVLTHEIMNSITPISSLASTVKDVMFENDGEEVRLRTVSSEDAENMEGAITTIQNRSEGLLNFVDVYRSLTRIPKPNFRYFRVSEIFERSRQLMKPKMKSMGIFCDARVFPPDMMITADPDLIDQVIINLMLNAMDAVKDVGQPQISILATLNNNNRVVMDFKDNGTGIKPDIMDKIFMPFFTSKKHGSGIGLSLSRQIMHLHKGSITVKSKPDEGTVFTLTF